MPIARLDAVGISLYGGTILPGTCEGRKEPMDAQTVMEVREGGRGREGGERGEGHVLIPPGHRLVRCWTDRLGGVAQDRVFCPAWVRLLWLAPHSGTTHLSYHLGGMFTANTMSSAIEALGMALPGTIGTGIQSYTSLIFLICQCFNFKCTIPYQ